MDMGEIMNKLYDLLVAGVTTPSRIQKVEWYASKVQMKIDEDHIIAAIPRPGQRTKLSKLLGNITSAYQAQIDLRNGRYSCSCEDFIFRGTFCKHLVAVMLRLLIDGREDLFDRVIQVLKEKDKTLIGRKGTVSFGDEGLDILFNGGIPKGELTGIFGEPKCGKTWLSLQIASSAKSALYIDTEGMLSRVIPLEKFQSVFSKRFKKKPEVKVVRIPNLQELLAFVGLSMSLVDSGKKVDVILREEQPLMQTAASVLTAKNKHEVLVIDSISKPLKEVFGSEQQNLTARAAVINAFLGKIADIALMHNVAVIIVIHGSSFRDREEKIYGGHTIKFQLKYLLRIVNEGGNKRTVYRELYPGFLPEKISAVLKTDYGFVSVKKQ